MWLKELIEDAQKAYEENGNIPVTIHSDHGLYIESAFDGTVVYLGSDGDELHPDDYYYDGMDMRKTKVFQIEGDGKVC